MTEFNTTIPTEEITAEINFIEGMLGNYPSRRIVIDSEDAYKFASDVCAKIKGSINKITALKKDLTTPLNDAKQEIIGKFKPALEDWERLVMVMKTDLLKYLKEADRRRAEEQARADDEDRKKRERLEQRALKAINKGNQAKADDLITQAGSLGTIVRGEDLKATGQVKRGRWKADVTDKLALIKSIAEGHAPLNLVDINMTVLNGLAGAMKQAMNYPGVEAKEERSLAIKAT